MPYRIGPALDAELCYDLGERHRRAGQLERGEGEYAKASNINSRVVR